MSSGSGLNHLEEIKRTLNYSDKIRIYFISITATPGCGMYLFGWTSLDDRQLNSPNTPVTEISKEKPPIRAYMPQTTNPLSW